MRHTCICLLFKVGCNAIANILILLQFTSAFIVNLHYNTNVQYFSVPLFLSKHYYINVDVLNPYHKSIPILFSFEHLTLHLKNLI